MAKNSRFTQKEWSWIMYDWANSIYATNIVAAIYPTIFTSICAKGDIMWGYGTSIATFIVAILAPFLGAIADYKGMKKKLFPVFAAIGILCTALMAIMGNWKIALVGYVISRIGFSGSCLFYDSFLTDVTTNERMDRVSSWGYAMGYIGGSTIPFVISIAILLIFDYNTFAQVFSVLIVSVWWAVFSIPFMKNVKQVHYIERDQRLTPSQILKNVIRTFRDICTHKGLLLFMIAYFFYIDGVDTVISISTAYGSTLGLGTTGMILALVVTQIVAMPCSIWFARIAEKVNTRRALMGAVSVYVVICLVGFYMGFSMEPSQKAYEDAINRASAPYSSEIDGETLEIYMNKAMTALRSDDPPAEMNELTLFESPNPSELALEEALKRALLDAADENRSLADAFNDAVGFSTVLFWLMAVLVGMVQGGIQAASRSYLGKLVPKERSNEFFGFFDIFGKFAAVIGPTLYASIASATGRSSFGVLGLAILFVCGLAILAGGKKHLDALPQ